MILQVKDLLIDAMGLCGVTEIDETPSSTEMAVLLRTANVMIDRWSSQRLLLRSTTPITVPITAGKQNYTIGLSGCDVTHSKPIKIYSAYVRDSGGLDTPVDVIDIETYNNLVDKTLANGPITWVAYDPGLSQQTVQKGTVYVYGVPDTTYTLYLEADTYLTEFVNHTDTLSFEPAYYEALIYNLAIRVFRRYNQATVMIPMDVTEIARESLNNLRTMNNQTVIAGLDVPGKVGSWNVYTDGTN